MLNAFRHQRNSHGDEAAATRQDLGCSTPFGIKGTLTTALPSDLTSVIGAQRLSASKELSLNQRNICQMSARCVLNAFRHQRNSHGCGIPTSRSTSTSAQRLSASKELSPPERLNLSLRGVGAQRLSASKELSRSIPGSCCSRLQVLNAFRHQRNSHCLLKSPWRDSIRAQRLSASKELSRRRSARSRSNRIVLNAFRHQRNSHTRRRSKPSRVVAVLNAFRHQRNSHTSAGRAACRCFRAQRLSASKELSR